MVIRPQHRPARSIAPRASARCADGLGLPADGARITVRAHVVETRRMQWRVLTGLALVLFAALASAQTAVTPLQLVQSFYAPNFDEERMPLSARLADVLKRAQAKSRELDEPVAGLDFSWTMGAQDAEDGWQKTLRLAVVKADDRKAAVQVTFRLFARNGERELHYELVRENGRWVVDDILYVDQDNDTLAGLLEKGARGED
jgi:hypothetical protein